MADIPLLKSPLAVSEIDATGTPDATTFLRGDGTWAAPPGSAGGATVVVKTADESVASSTAVQSDDHLLFPVGIGDVWVAHYIIGYTGATGGDIKFAFSGPAGSTIYWGTMGLVDSTTGVSGSLKTQRSGSGASELNLGTAGFGTTALLWAYIDNPTTAGNVQLQWAQFASNATATTIYTGSHLIAHQA